MYKPSYHKSMWCLCNFWKCLNSCHLKWIKVTIVKRENSFFGEFLYFPICSEAACTPPERGSAASQNYYYFWPLVKCSSHFYDKLTTATPENSSSSIVIKQPFTDAHSNAGFGFTNEYWGNIISLFILVCHANASHFLNMFKCLYGTARYAMKQTRDRLVSRQTHGDSVGATNANQRTN